jgi:hypothetical protein
MTTQIQMDFARARSLQVPNVPVPYSEVVALARQVVQEERAALAADVGRAMAFDQREDDDPLDLIEKAGDRHASWVKTIVPNDEIEREKGRQLFMVGVLAGAKAARAGMKIGAEDRLASDARPRLPAEDRRQAADAAHRPSQLDKLLAGVRNPSAGGLTGR